MRYSSIVLRLLSLLLSLSPLGAADFIDPSFRTGVAPITRGTDGPVYAMDQSPDGRIVIAGDFARVNGVRRHAIARLLADGSLDTSFDAGMGPDGDITSVVALADGSVLVGGRFQSWGNELAGDHLVRLKPTGAMDHDFAATPAWDGEVVQLVRRDEGTIMVLERRSTEGVSRTLLQRRLPSGLLDTQFAPTIAEGATLNSLARTTNGGLLIVGRFSEFDGYATTNLVRLKPDDSVDTTFAAAAAAEAGELFSVASASDGRVAIGGSATNTRPSAFLAVIRPDGQRDPQFTPTSGPYYPVTKLAFDGNGVLLEVDQYSEYFTLVSNNRFTPHGEQLGFLPFSPSANSAPPLPLADGGVLWAVDSVYNSLGWITRTFANGSVDPDFVRKAPPDDGFTRAIITLAALPGGDIFANGTYSFATNLGRFVRNQTLVRLDPNGAPRVETNAQLSFWGADSESSVLLPGQGQKLYVAGNFYAANGDAHVPFLARLNGDGSIEPTFRPGFATYISSGNSQSINDLALLDDGRLYAGGRFTGPNTSPNSGLLLARFQPDGSLDPSFTPLRPPGSAFNTSAGVSCIAPLDQDQVLFWGSLGSGGATVGPKLHAYAAAGRESPGPDLVAEAGMPLGSAYVRRMIRLKDGRVLLLGSFSSIAGIPRHNLAILRPDLTVDETFDSGSGPNDDVLPAIELTDGRILVGGMFTRWNGKEHRRLVLLRPDGQLDESFDAGTGPDDIPIHLIEQPDGRVLIAGRFTNLDGRGTARLARLVIPPAVPPVPAHLILQPQTAISTNLAAPAVLKVVALGTAPMRYQWFREGVALTEDGGFAGTGSPLLTIQGTNLLSPADYYVEVMNDVGRERSTTVFAGLASGTMDSSFTTNSTGPGRFMFGPGQLILPKLIPDTAANGLVRRVFVFGSFTSYDGVPAPGLMVIDPNGSRDEKWTPPPGVSGADAMSAAFQADGRLILAGKFTRANGAPRDVVMRLNADGSLDESFDPGDELTVTPPPGFPKQTSAVALVLDGDGIFIASAQFPPVLRRLKANGITDTGFLATNINFLGNITTLAPEPGSERGLLVGGNIFAAQLKKGPQTFYRGLVRILRDGRLDTNYNAHPRRPGQSAQGNVSAILPAADGGAWVAGDFAEFDSALGPLVHLDATGQADTNFVVHLPGTPPVPFSGKALLGVSPLSDGNFLLNYKRQTDSPDTFLLMQPDGTLTVTAGGPAEGYRTSGLVTPLGDGRYLIPVGIPVGKSATYPTLGRFFLTSLARTPVTNVPPIFLKAPSDVALTNRPGYQEPLVLSAVVQAGGNVQMQWQWNGVPLAAETNATLLISEPRPENSGQYRLEVSNAAGSISAVANVTIAPAAPIAPPLSVERRAGDARIHLHFSPQPGARYHLERGADFGTWETVTDPAVRVSDSEFAPALEAGSVFFRLVLEP